MPDSPDVRQCPVTGDPCSGKGCAPDAEKCTIEASRILYLDPSQFTPEIKKVAAELHLEEGLFADFVTDWALGPGASNRFKSESGQDAFENLDL